MARVERNLGPVAAGGTVTLDLQGGREDNIVGSIFSDQPGNVTVEQAADGTNYDIVTTFPVTANTGRSFSDTVFWPKVRVRFNNTGASPTTAFRFYARFSSAGDS
jgi:hypothetical protein